MIESIATFEKSVKKRRRRGSDGRGATRIKRIASINRISTDLVNEIHSPIDSINRFLNLALMTIGEDSPSRAFLLESKDGVRRTSTLLKRLNDHIKKIEKEIREIREIGELSKQHE